MVELTPEEARIYVQYEFYKATKEVALVLGMNVETIRNHTKSLREKGLIRVIGGNHRLGYQYEQADIEYFVQDKRSQVSAGVVKRVSHLSDDQLLYLHNHKHLLPRKVLAERLGITKTRLNFVLMGIQYNEE